MSEKREWQVEERGLDEWWVYAVSVERRDASDPLILVCARDSVLGGKTDFKSDEDARAEAIVMAERIRALL